MALTLLRATGQQRSIDAAAVRAALALLVCPNCTVELRGVPSGRSVFASSSNIMKLVEGAERLSDDDGVYFTLNPLPLGHSSPAKNADMVSRWWLLIDVDPIRTSGDPKDNATDEEKEHARKVLEKVRAYLASLGWPAPVLIDSGNGWHLLYRIDLPNNDHAKQLVKATLYNLGSKFDTPEAGVDRSVHSVSRISKLPGTWAKKGLHSAERPHRLARIVFAPNSLVEVVSVDLLTITAGLADAPVITPVQPAAKEPTGLHTLRASDGEGGARAYAQKALDNECAAVRLALPGPKEGRNNALNRAAFSMGTLVAGGQILQQAVEGALAEAAIGCGLTERETYGTIRSGLTAGMTKPREIPERKDKSSPAKEPKPGEVIVIQASTIRPKKIEWLWPNRIPLGKLTTFAGQTGQGKTFVTCDIIARMTRGDTWPDGQPSGGEIRQALFISGDDEADDTIVPRLIESGADMTRIWFLKPEVQADWTLAALKVLDVAIEQMGESVGLVVLDPPTSYMGDVDDHKNAELRSVLTPFKDWAAAHRVAVVLITHINKAGGAKVEAMARVMGSVAWVTGVRAAFMFVPDPEDSKRQLFLTLKMNLGEKGKGLAYQIKKTEALAKVEWLGEVDTTADEAINRESKKPRGVIASEWLVDRFRERLEWESEDLFTRAGAEGVSRKAIFDAKTALNLPRARRTCQQNGDIVYFWWVPPDWPPLTVPATGPTPGTIARLPSSDEERL